MSGLRRRPRLMIGSGFAIALAASCSDVGQAAGEQEDIASCTYRNSASYQLLLSVAQVINGDPLEADPPVAPEDATAYFDAQTRHLMEDLDAIRRRDLSQGELSPSESAVVDAFEKENPLTPCSMAELNEALLLHNAAIRGYSTLGQ